MEIEWLFNITALCFEELHFCFYFFGVEWKSNKFWNKTSALWLMTLIRYSSSSLFILFVVYCDSVSCLSFGYCLSGNRCKRIFRCFLFILFYFLMETWDSGMRLLCIELTVIYYASSFINYFLVLRYLEYNLWRIY